MKQILLVALREIWQMLRRPSFYIATFGVPAFTGLLFFGLAFVGAGFGGDLPQESSSVGNKPIGIVDQAGVIKTIPAAFHQRFLPLADEAAARNVAQQQRIGSYFIIPPDYLETGMIKRVSGQITISSANAPDTQALRTLLRANLSGNVKLAQRLEDPLTLKSEIVGATGNGTVAQSPPSQGAISAVTLLLAFSILNGGGWLVQAIAEEKENRTIEIILTSLRPTQLMAGKLLGLGAISLLQLGLWLGLGRGVLSLGRSFAPTGGALNALHVWPWIIVFFLLGFLFFGSIMLALGAVGASARESGQISSFLTIPLLMPLWFGSALTDAPNGTLALVLSLIPITAPVTMLIRLGQGPVSLWQIGLSIVLLALAVVGAIWVAARLFRSATLLTGEKPTPRALWRALRSA